MRNGEHKGGMREDRSIKDGEPASQLMCLGGAIHELQKERGLTSIHVGSGQGTGVELLDTQRAYTETRWAGRSGAFLQAVIPLEKIKAQREIMDGGKASYYEACDFYTSLLNVCLAKVGSIVGALKGQQKQKEEHHQQQQQQQQSQLQSEKEEKHEKQQQPFDGYVCFLRLKESIGQERALIGGALAAGRVETDPKVVAKVKSLISRQDGLARAFTGFISGQLRPQCDSFISQSEECHRVKTIVAQGGSAAGLGMGALDWFRACTSRMNRMLYVEEELCRAISSVVDEDLQLGLVGDFTRGQLCLQQLLDSGREGGWLLSPGEILPGMPNEPFAQGGMGSVYMSTWRQLPVAVKTLSRLSGKAFIGGDGGGGGDRGVGGGGGGGGDGDSSSSQQESEDQDASLEEALSDLAKEIELLASLRHPRIVLFLGASYCPNLGLMCIMELMSGGTLQDLMDENSEDEGGVTTTAAAALATGVGGAAAPAAAVGGVHGAASRACRRLSRIDKASLAEQIAQGICFLHGATPPIIHRDLKPSNVFVDAYLNAKIGDFGLAKHLPSEKGTAYRMTGATGTARYMAPEVLLNEPYGVTVDTYSFGLVMMSLFSGREVWKGAGFHDVVQAAETKTSPLDHPCNARLMTDASGGIAPCWRGIESVRSILVDCASGDPKERPSFERVFRAFQGPAEMGLKGRAFSHSPSETKRARQLSNVSVPEDDRKDSSLSGARRRDNHSSSAAHDRELAPVPEDGPPMVAAEARAAAPGCTCTLM